MTDPSKPLENARHEAFAREWAKGVSAAEAMRKAGYEDNPANAKRMTKNDRIVKRKEYLQGLAANDTVLSIKEKREFLARVVRAKPMEACEDNPDCELGMSKAGPFYKFPDKAAAIKLDNDLAGDSLTTLPEITIRIGK